MSTSKNSRFPIYAVIGAAVAIVLLVAVGVVLLISRTMTTKVEVASVPPTAAEPEASRQVDLDNSDVPRAIRFFGEDAQAPGGDLGKAVEAGLGKAGTPQREAVSGIDALSSSRVLRTMTLSDDQRYKVEVFEQEFDIMATQRLQASSALVRRTGQDYQNAMMLDDESARNASRAKAREAMAVHLQIVALLEQEYLDGVRPLLSEPQKQQLTDKLSGESYSGGLVTPTVESAGPEADASKGAARGSIRHPGR